MRKNPGASLRGAVRGKQHSLLQYEPIGHHAHPKPATTGDRCCGTGSAAATAGAVAKPTARRTNMAFLKSLDLDDEHLAGIAKPRLLAEERALHANPVLVAARSAEQELSKRASAPAAQLAEARTERGALRAALRDE